MFELEAENRRMHDLHETALEGIISADPTMLRICRTLEKLANNNISCTLMGETGTGKEVIAQALHNISDRKHKRFILKHALFEVYILFNEKRNG